MLFRSYMTPANVSSGYQPLDSDLTALAGLNATAGLVEQTGAAAFTKRALGVAAGTSVPTRADADARYAPISVVGTVTNVTGTVPVVSSGGATPAISMPAATTSVSGHLTAADWNTFNGKAPPVSIGTTPPGSPVAGQQWFYTDAVAGGGQMFVYYNDGNTSQWVPVAPGGGSSTILQTVSTQTGAMATGTTVMPYDDTIPQISEGNEYMTLAITPRSATSKLIIEVMWNGGASSTNPQLTVALFQDSTANALAAVSPTCGTGFILAVSLKHTMTSGTTSATTFRVRAGASAAATTTFNGGGGVRAMGGVMASSIVIQEVL